MTTVAARPGARTTALFYLGYVAIAGVGQFLAIQDPSSVIADALQVAGTLWYALVSVMLCRLFGDPTRGVGALAMVSVAIGCVLQSLYYALGLGRGAELLALTFFGLFLICLGYLVIRSRRIPRAIGIGLIAGGVGWGLIALPMFPASLTPVLILAAMSELVLLLWLLIKGVRPA